MDYQLFIIIHTVVHGFDGEDEIDGLDHIDGRDQFDGRDRIDGKDRFDGKDQIDGAFYFKRIELNLYCI